MKPVPALALAGALLAVLAPAAGLAVAYSGIYNISATSPHLQPVFSLLEIALRHSVRLRARDIKPPALDPPERILRGAALYRDKCVQCHGAPGVAQDDIGKSMQPLPGPLVDALQRWRPREIYWITRHGIKMSGMPAWEFHLSDGDLWSVVAFMQHLPTLTPGAYRDITTRGAVPTVSPAAAPPRQPDAARGRIALAQYACQSCHIIPGVTGPRVYVGRALDDLAARKYIAGTLPTTRDNLVRWIRDPKGIDPHTPMPVLGVTERDARDMTAYLLTLR